MTSDEIDTIVKRLCLDNQLSSTVLTQARTDAINLLAHRLVAAAPEYFEKKVSLSNAGTNVFALPSDCLMLKSLWDYDGSVGSVSGAADNGAGLIRITHDTSIADGDRVTIHDVAGCTEANGTWKAVYVDATHIDLYGSVFSSVYTSGGKIFIEAEDTYKYPVERMPSAYQDGADETYFFLRQDDIIINDPEFGNDLIALYRYLPTALTEIPARMHTGIYAFGVINLIELRDRYVKVGDQFVESAEYQTKRKNYDFCQDLWKATMDMAGGFTPVLSPDNISDRKPKRWI